MADDKVILRYKKSDTGEMRQKKFCEVEFLERLVRHVLPKGFRSVRASGFLAPAAKKMLMRLQLLLEVKLPAQEPAQTPKVTCPCCKGSMTAIMHKVSEIYFKEEIEPFVAARSPPVLV